MATAISSFYPEITPSVPGFPKPALDRYIIDIIRDLCFHAEIWKKKLTPIDTVVVEQATDLAFTSASPCTITSTTTSFVTAGLVDGDEINTDHQSDSFDEKANTGPYVITTAAANTLTLNSTEALITDASPGTITISKIKYALSHASGDIARVREVRFAGDIISPVTEDWLNENVHQWRIQQATYPTWYMVDDENRKLQLVYAPNEAMSDAIEVWVALKPSTTATTVEDFIYNQYKHVIAKGVLAMLQSLPNQQWSAPEYAQLNNALYMQGRNRAWHDANKGPTKATFRIMG